MNVVRLVGKRFLFALFLSLLGWAQIADAHLTVLHTFDGNDGSLTRGSLLRASDGNFYGVTQYGGELGDGTVFRMDADGSITTLATFSGPNGRYPVAGLIEGNDGAFYGTTSEGGASYLSPDQPGCGAVYRITSAGVLTLFASYSCYEGTGGLFSRLTKSPDGSLYGTAFDGSIYRVSPTGQLTVIAQSNDLPLNGIILASDGNFYGAGFNGGPQSRGSIFRMTPAGTITDIASFQVWNGSYPEGPLLEGQDGKLYGTTSSDGPGGAGTVFRISKDGALETLASFDGSNGSAPVAGLIQAADGTIFGTTRWGGLYGAGTVFELAPDLTLSTLQAFNGITGNEPTSALTFGPDGSLYGVTAFGGFPRDGTIFRLTTEPVLPHWSSPTPAEGASFTIPADVPFSLDLRADAADSSRVVRLTGASLPPAATFDGVVGSVATGTYDWTPPRSGIFVAWFTACDLEAWVCNDTRHYLFEVTKRKTALSAQSEILQVSPTALHLRMKATLVASNPSAPVASRIVNFNAPNGAQLCSAITDAGGTAACGTPVTYARTTVNKGYTATFPGDDAYEGSSASGTLLQ